MSSSGITASITDRALAQVAAPGTMVGSSRTVDTAPVRGGGADRVAYRNPAYVAGADVSGAGRGPAEGSQSLAGSREVGAQGVRGGGPLPTGVQPPVGKPAFNEAWAKRFRDA